MFPNPSSGLSLIKIIGGISKSLSIANEIIPLYQQAKPMIQNARNAFSSLKQVNKQQESVSLQTNASLQNNLKQNKKVITSRNNFNNPTFFR